MRTYDGGILLSASDLMRLMGCAHATTLDLMRLRGDGPEPDEDGEDAVLLQRQGDAHEAAHLARLKAAGRGVVEIARGDLATDAAATRAALARGAEVVFQGAFLSGAWGGWSDFLQRVDRPSALGDFSYEVADTKLKCSVAPKHVLQLVLYSDLLAEVQGVLPDVAHVELGTGERASLRLAEHVHYARAARARLQAFVAAPPPTRPVPCEDCGLCRWAGHCEAVWRDEDSLFGVAGIARGQVKRLEAEGIATMAALTALDRPVRGMAQTTRDRLVTQAALQEARKTGAPAHVLRAPEPAKGFDLLPEPQAGDLFYDIEGDPHYPGGLEYLHGVWCDGSFRAFWAHEPEAEARAVGELFAFFRARLEAFPKARIYHYAAYEITALRRLTTKYGVGEAFFDRLLRERRFVDLYAVVRGGLIGSEPNYSIKSMEAFYGRKREGEVRTAGGSVVAYERWRESGDQTILDEIEAYNRVDCISTEELRDWLVGIRPAGPWPVPDEDAQGKEAEADAEAAGLRTMLAASELPEDRRAMLFDLGMFHAREAKPAKWAVFDAAAREADELIDDLDCLAGLQAVGPVETSKRSFVRTYRFPAQETKLRAGQGATVAVAEGGPVSVGIEALDRRARRVTVKVGPGKADLLTDRLALLPDWPIDTKVIGTALRGVIADQCGPRAFRAVDDLLSRAAPRLTGGPLGPVDDPVSGTIAAVAAMDGTVLPIQGPPGTGKTHVTARAILALVRGGARVGVASNSHEAIRNVLMGCLAALEEADLPLTLDLVHKTGAEDGYPEGCPVRRVSDNAKAAAGRQVVGATAWFFCRDENVQAFDWLFVDEAGQVSLANIVAMGRAARNIVLVGDPRQLPQVIQGAHPEPAGLSCLEWMLAGQATVPTGRGIFLPQSRRMHPEVCRFVSDQVYDGRLESHPDTARQAVGGTAYPPAGAFWVPVPHEGNVQVAAEEVAALVAAVRNLTGGTWTGKDGRARRLVASDIIVVAPYNAQVNALREALPEAVRVGTVDRFQGQEAPVCLVSMTASSAEETGRGMEFLVSLNRINVAVSRAKGLALVFGSPRLREAKCRTVGQMRLVNAICALPLLPG